MNKLHGYLPRRVMTYTAASLAMDVDGLKTGAAPLTSPVTYSGGDLDGAIDEGKVYMRVPTVSTTGWTGAWNVDEFIVFNGFAASGQARTVKVKLTDIDGGETVTPTLGPDNPEGIGIDKLVSIDVPAMLIASGTLSFGVASGAEYDFADQAVSVAVGVVAGTVLLEEDGGDIVTITLPAHGFREQLIRKIGVGTASVVIIRV